MSNTITKYENISAYEVDGGPSGIYWEIFAPDTSGEYITTIHNTTDSTNVTELMNIARERCAKLTIYTQEWYTTYGEGKE